MSRTYPFIVQMKHNSKFVLVTGETWIGKADNPETVYVTSAGGLLRLCDCSENTATRAFTQRALQTALATQ